MAGVARGSLVFTREGFKPIQDIGIGDLVLTHLGNWRPAIARLDMGTRPVVQIRAQGVSDLFVTPDHKVWGKVIDKANAKRYIYSTAPKWYDAEDLDGGWVNQKLPQIEKSNLSVDDWNMVGQYIGYAHITGRSDLLFSILTRLLNSELSEDLKDMLKKCGREQATRQVPIEGLCLDRVSSEALLSGYVFGRSDVKNKMETIFSVSKGLTLGMAMVAQRARGVVASIYSNEKSPKGMIWGLSWTEGPRQQNSVIMEDGSWKKVKDSAPHGTMDTWDLQVADDGSYMVEGCIVKCGDIYPV